MVLPLTLVDTTYGTNQASDWVIKDHKFDQLKGSDKWELTIPINGGANITLELDYLEEIGGKNSGVFDTKVKEAEQGGSDISGLVEFESSMSFNYEQLGLNSAQLAQVFGKNKNSPGTTGTDYEFLAPFEDWVPEVMYEFSVDMTGISGTVDLATLVADLGLLHVSPNKLGGNKVEAVSSPNPPPYSPAVPEPSTILLFGVGLVGLAYINRRRAA